MKTAIALLFAFVLMGFSTSVCNAQETISCCSTTSATAEFAALGGNAMFVSLHEAPAPFTGKLENGKMISFTTSDGKDGQAYFVRSPKKTNKVLLVFQEWWGLNDYIKQKAEELQKELGNVNVYALDLYDGKVATDPNEAGKIMMTTSEERIRAIIEGAIRHVGPKAKIATIGWCFGGGWSLQASLMAGKQAIGCVMFYGMPEKNIEKLKTLHADVLGLFALQDKNITPAVVDAFQQNMKAAGKHLEVKSYNAVHAFANPSNPKYDKEAAADANARALAFLKKHLGV